MFVSSTFSDLVAERSALQHAVFPSLKQFCLRLGCRFQDVDLRWGISAEAGLDQSTMRVCLREVARCQETTPRPNFIILLGDRYGWCPLPPDIPAEDHDEIHASLPPAGRVLLTHWYARDDNTVPPVYRLRPRVRGTPFESDSTWSQDVERPLHEMLGAATSSWPDARMTRYVASATEQEILAGALRVTDAREHVFCFVREISDLPNEAHLAGFLDPDPAGRARALALRSRLEERLGPNLEKYQARWLGRAGTPVSLNRCRRAVDRAVDLVRERGMSGAGSSDDEWRSLAMDARSVAGTIESGPSPDAAQSPISLDHLPALCVDVFLRLARVIVTEVAQQEAVDPGTREAQAHRRFGAERAAVFAGRGAELAGIAEYVREGHPQPFCVVGAPGSGKTALLARAAELVPEWLPGAQTFIRFIGATPESTDGRTLLRSLWQALDDTEAPDTFAELARGLPRVLQNIPAERPVAVFLDALDMLAPADRADRLAWLPKSLPASVRLIISTAPGERADTLKRRVPGGRHIELGSLSEPDARWLMKEWLARAGRGLTPAQLELIMDGYRGSPWPLYLKLAFETAIEWTSELVPPPLGASAEEMIADLFTRLSDEADHGSTMVERCLAYLAAARHGLTEDELLEVLSRDAEVMASFRRRSPRSPPVSRLPVVVWSRLYYDLQSYLSEQSADGTTVFTFYHQQVRRVASERFLGTVAAERHRHLARYFEEDTRLAVLAQSGAAAFNLRKLSEQAYQETLGASWSSLAQTLGGLDWLQAKVESGLGYDATADFSRGIRALPPPSRAHADDLDTIRSTLNAFGRAFGQEFHAFQRWPRSAAQQMHNNLVALAPGSDDPVTARLEGFTGTPYPRGAAWLRRLNAGPATAVPSTLIRAIPAHEGEVTALAVSPDGAWLATGGGDGMVRVLDAGDGSEAAGFAACQGRIVGLAWAGVPGHLRLVTGGSDGGVSVWDWEAERAETSFTITDSRPRCLLGLPDGQVVTGGDDFSVRVWNGAQSRPLHRHRDRVLCLAADRRGSFVASGSADRTIRIASLTDGTRPAVLRGSQREVRCLVADPEGAWLASGDETGAIGLWDLRTLSARRSFPAHRHWVTCLAAVPDRSLLLSGSGDRTIGVWDLATGLRQALLRGHRRGVTCISTAPDQQWFATGGEDGTVCFWQTPDARSTRSATTMEHEGPVTALAALPDQHGVASASEDATIRFWRPEGDSAASLHGHIGAVISLAAAAGRLVSAGADRSVRSWHLDGSGRVDLLSGAPSPLPNPQGHQRAITCMLALPGDEDVTSAGEDGAVWVWNARGARPPRRLEPVSGSLGALAAGEDWIAAGGTPREITVWERASGRISRSFPAHDGQVTCLAGAGPAVVASGGLDGTIVLSNLETGASRVLATGLGKVRSLATDPAGDALAAGGDSGTVWLWRATRNVEPLRLLGHEESVRALRFVPGTPWLATASDEGRVCLWNSGDGSLLTTMHAGGPVTVLLVQPPDRLWIGTANAGVALYQVIPAR